MSERLDLFPETIETILSFLHQLNLVTLVNKMPQLTMLHMPARLEKLPPIIRNDATLAKILSHGTRIG